MIDFLLDLISYGIRYGLSWVTLSLAIVALFKSRKLRKRFNRFLPLLFRDEDPEVGKYIQNQKRIESKVDLLLQERGIVWNAEPNDSDASTVGRKSLYAWRMKFRVPHVDVSTLRKGILNLRRKKRMKEYLKKLTSRKFQALLVSLVINIISAILFMSGTVDMEGVINEWMPIINMTIGTISTWVYIWVEGSIDKSKEVTHAPTISTSEFEG